MSSYKGPQPPALTGAANPEGRYIHPGWAEPLPTTLARVARAVTGQPRQTDSLQKTDDNSKEYDVVERYVITVERQVPRPADVKEDIKLSLTFEDIEDTGT